MKIIRTKPSNLHKEIEEIMKSKISSPEEREKKRFQRDREQFMARVHQFLGKNWLEPVETEQPVKPSSNCPLGISLDRIDVR